MKKIDANHLDVSGREADFLLNFAHCGFEWRLVTVGHTHRVLPAPTPAVFDEQETAVIAKNNNARYHPFRAVEQLFDTKSPLPPALVVNTRSLNNQMKQLGVLTQLLRLVSSHRFNDHFLGGGGIAPTIKADFRPSPALFPVFVVSVVVLDDFLEVFTEVG